MTSLAIPSFVLPGAIAAGIFFGIAGIQYVAAKDRNRNENIAMTSDLFVFLVLAAHVAFIESG
jgi:hypothetical protein